MVYYFIINMFTWRYKSQKYIKQMNVKFKLEQLKQKTQNVQLDIDAINNQYVQ